MKYSSTVCSKLQPLAGAHKPFLRLAQPVCSLTSLSASRDKSPSKWLLVTPSLAVSTAAAGDPEDGGTICGFMNVWRVKLALDGSPRVIPLPEGELDPQNCWVAFAAGSRLKDPSTGVERDSFS